MSYHALLPLMKSKGCTLTPEEFQERVNIVFHNHESLMYDEIHSDLKNSLQEQVNLLINDLFKYPSSVPDKIHMLDVGCGTGLSTQYLLNSRIEPNISQITMLDSADKMLEKAKDKAGNWKKPVEFVNGYLDDLQDKFDLVIICSVLHHIPNLDDFLNQIDQIIKPNGILLHLQDPNADYFNDELYNKRLASYEKRGRQNSKRITAYIPKSFKRFVNRKRGKQDYIDQINDQLLEEKVIASRMSADELWSVTDIHVPTKYDTSRKGISLSSLKKKLSNFNLVNQRSYGFFGKLKHDLNEDFEREEEKLIAENHLNGRNLACIWIKRT